MARSRNCQDASPISRGRGYGDARGRGRGHGDARAHAHGRSSGDARARRGDDHGHGGFGVSAGVDRGGACGRLHVRANRSNQICRVHGGLH